MTDTTDKALDALQERLKEQPVWGQSITEILNLWHKEREEANAAISALRAQLATARAEALREAANLCGDMAQTLNGVPTGSPHSQDAVDVIASGLSVAQKAVLSLIDTPTPSAPSPEAVARAALEGAAYAISELAGTALTAEAEEHAFQMAEELQELASDPATIAVIIAKAAEPDK